MAKKALIQKQQRNAEVQGARLHAVPPMWPTARGVPQVRSVPGVPASDGSCR